MKPYPQTKLNKGLCYRASQGLEYANKHYESPRWIWYVVFPELIQPENLF